MFTIRKIDRSLVSELSVLAKRTYLESYSRLLKEEALINYTESEFSIKNLEKEVSCETFKFYGAITEEKTLVGYIKYRVSGNCIISEENSLEIDKLYILDSHKRSGIGKKLIKSSIKRESKLINIVWAKVFKLNLQACAFYEKQGFEKAGEIKFKFLDTMLDDYIYTKRSSNEKNQL